MHLSAARTLSTLIACAFLVSACGSSPSPARATTSAQPTVHSVSFHRDIAPILFERCATCHRPIESESGPRAIAARDPKDPLCIAGAPFPLLDYRDARDHAREIAAATKSRVMPPWLPAAGYGEFQHERRLTDEQIALIQKWVEQGAPEGDRADARVPPTWPVGWQLGTPDLVLTVPDSYTLKSGGRDVFRNFVVPVPGTATRYVRAIEFRAQNPRVLHHANLAIDPTRATRRLDRADPGPGFAAMADDEVRNVFGWSPGKMPTLDPEDTAWTLPQGSDLVVQLHMVPGAKSETVQPSIGLFFAKTPPTREPIVVKLESKAIDIPAGADSYVVEDSYVLPTDVDVVTAYPHAHYLAKDMQGIATLPDGSKKWLIWITQWDVRWQDQYRYATPLFLPRGTTLSMRFSYDNSDHNPHNPHRPSRRVMWGPQSDDEMAALWIEVIPRVRDDARVLAMDFDRRALAADIAGAELHVRSEPRASAPRNLLAAKYLEAGRGSDAQQQLEEALRIKSDDALAHSNLGSLLLAQGRVDEAMRHLREAVRLEPNNDRVHFNLANALNAAGRTDGAVREYQRALQINGDDADSHFNLAMLLGPRGQLDTAVAHLKRAIDINPQNAEAHRNLGVALGLQGKIDAAIEADRAALRINPGLMEAQRHLDQLLRVSSFSRRTQ